MPTITLITNDTPGNQSQDAQVIDQAAALNPTDIVVDGSPLDSSVISDITPPSANDPRLSAPVTTSQTFTLTVNGSGAVSARVQIYGSNDGISWNAVGSISASGSNGVAVAAFMTNAPYAYWTSDTEFTSPGATASVSISF